MPTTASTDPTQPISLESSALLRRAIAFDDTHVVEYYGPGEYPNLHAEKAEVETRIAKLETESEGIDAKLLAVYLRGMFLPDELEPPQSAAGHRQRAFAALQLGLDRALNEIDVRRMGAPRRTDPLFEALPELWGELNAKDRMLELRPQLLHEQTWNGAMPALTIGTRAVYLHPRLAAQRELVMELGKLTHDPGLSVSVALDPFRTTAAEKFATRLLEDYWKGIKMTAGTLDSLDAHDVGNPTFHAATNRDPVAEFFNPLLGTWFDWDSRGDDEKDPVKRLYVQEVSPPTDRDGHQVKTIINLELHSERDTTVRAFVHVDGKVVAYDAERYGPSKNKPMIRPGKPQASRKLWRVDGRLGDAQWLTLVGFHFRGNELIEEHLSEAFAPVACQD